MSYLNKCLALMIILSPYCMADSLSDMLLACAQKDNNLLRLGCYDKLAKKIDTPIRPLEIEANNTLSAPKTIPKASQPQKTQVVQAQPIEQHTKWQDENSEFGLEKRQREEEKIEQIQANIVKVQKDPYGHQIITLDNGQVWRQTDSTRLKLVEKNTIFIKRGALGSFFIGKENSNRRIRAKRVK